MLRLNHPASCESSKTKTIKVKKKKKTQNSVPVVEDEAKREGIVL